MVATNKVPAVNGEWECMECGDIEEGLEARRPAKCPECSAPASALEFFSYEEGEDEWDEEEEDEEEDEELGEDENEDDEFEDDER